ncbi:hypothetical protein [Arthrobacter sp. SX1312]|uniref:hypothetical protein n=1 Tax=Arthrobacter sp. SX1312 TaxID=2058896 RepID=UPI000CE50EF0|nr:hypothetical protein [Arthrobacter sp. SX1312]
MTGTRRRRYRVRLRRAVAGSFLAAASAASLAGLTAAPALAVPPAVTAPSDSTRSDASDLIPGVHLGEAGVASWGAAAAGVTVPSAQERLAGVRADLDTAVLLRLVTPEQASGFYAQIERRVAAGL